MKAKLNSFLVLLALSSATQAATQYWSGTGTWNTTNTNWSAAATPGGPYTSVWANGGADVATFEGTAGTVTAGASMNVGTLTFNTTGYTLSAASAVNLTSNTAATINVAAGVTAGIGTNVSIKSSAASQSWILSGSNKTTSILDLTGTVTATTNNNETIRDITVNVNTGGLVNGGSSIVVGSSIAGSGSVLNISGGTLTIGGANANASLILSNTGGIAADTTITLSSGAITFASTSTGNGLRFGPTGTISAAGTNLAGTFNLDGGTLTTNKIFMGSNTYTGTATYNATFNFNGGTLKALATNNTDFMGALRGTGYVVKSGGAKINSNGKDITIAQPLLHDSTLGATLDGGLTKEGLGTLTLSGANTYTGTTTINSGKLAITAPYSAISATTINNAGRLRVNSSGVSPSSLSAVSTNTGGGFEFNLGTFNAANQPAVSVGTLNANDNYTVDIEGSSIPSGVTITLLTYTSKTGSGLPAIGNMPAGMTLASGPTDTGSSIQIVVNTGSATAFTWSKGDGDWETSSLNWNTNAAAYAEPAVVTFPDLVETGNGVNEVNVTANRSPYTVTINNTGTYATNAYSFSGAGGISGITGITKTGAGVVTFSNPNSYTGTLSITGGHVIKAAADTTSGNITVADTCTFALSGVTDGSGQTITLAGPGAGTTNIIAASTAIQRGSLQSLSGNSVWDGAIILSGTAGTAGNTRIGVQNGATLTLNGNIGEGVVGMSPLFRAGDSVSDTITINGVGSWTGPTRLFSNGGVVKLGGNDRFPTGRLLTVGTSAGATTLDLAGNSQTIAGIDGSSSGKVINTGSASTLTSNPAAPATFPGVIQNNISLVIGGTAIQSLSGDNTYTGNTTINTGASLTVAAAGELKFYPTNNGITNSAGGSGTLQFDGTLRTDLSGADSTSGNSWTLVDKSTLSTNFGTTFTVSDANLGIFTETALNSGIWELTDSGKKWTFTESDGKLIVTDASGYSTWQAANSTSQTVDGDHDNDGVDNGVEYFLGGNTNTTGFTALPAPVGGSVTWTKGAGYTGIFDTDFKVQSSTDLNTWTDAAASGTPGVPGTVYLSGSDVTYTLPTTPTKSFVRLLVNPN